MQQHMHKILFCENKILFCVMKKEFIFAKFNMHLLLHMFAFFMHLFAFVVAKVICITTNYGPIRAHLSSTYHKCNHTCRASKGK